MQSFLNICNEKENPEKWLWQRKMSMREVTRRQKIKKMLKESDFMPVKLGGVEYQANS